MIESKQNFLKGINRRFTRKQSVNPDFFYTLQNARIFSRGETGTVKRIKGYQKFNQNSKDYSGTLDMISYREFFIILYKSGSDFGVDVIDTDGAIVFTDTYSGEATDEGSLTVSSDNIFITPHNKILYYDDGAWILSDFISQIGGITDISLTQTGNSGSSTISVKSGVNANQGTKAEGSIWIWNNNTPVGDTDTFKISVDGNVTSDISVTYGDTRFEIEEKIVTALKNTPAIVSDWEIISVHADYLGKKPNAGRVILRAKNVGSQYNKVPISIIDSDYNITDNDDGAGYYDEDERAWKYEKDDDEEKIDISTNLKNSDEFNITLDIREPRGGIDASGDVGPLEIRIEVLGYWKPIITDRILDTDTYLDIGLKIEEALLADSRFVSNYSLTSTDTGTQYNLDIQAQQAGKNLNSDIIIRFRETPNVPLTEKIDLIYDNIEGGTYIEPSGHLENFEDYWYKVRYRFKDGHVTNSTLPKHINTEYYGEVRITLDGSIKDIDGNRAKIEIFRKTAGRKFLLIDRISPTSDSHLYIDSGKLGNSSPEQKSNIWTKSHNSQTVIDNRLVRGGVNYFTEEYTGYNNIDFRLVSTTEDQQVPNKTTYKLYIKPLYKDGTVGYHQYIKDISTDTFDKKLQIKQDGVLSNSDKDIHSIGAYAEPIPRTGEESIKFNTVEISNSDIPTIEDQDLYPNKTRILFGFKYFYLGGNKRPSTRIKGWDHQEDQYGLWTVSDVREENNSIHPREITIPVFGVPTKYLRIGTYVDDAGNYSSVYKLAIFDALNEAVKTNELRLRFRTDINNSITNSDVITQLITGTNNDILSVDVKVTNLIDHSVGKEVRLQDLDGLRPFLTTPKDTRIYLELEKSIFDEISNSNINSYDLSKQVEKGRGIELSTNTPIPMELLDFYESETPSLIENDSTAEDGGNIRSIGDGEEYFYYQWDWGKYDLINHSIEHEGLIYLGSKENEVSPYEDLDVTGFENKKEEAINYAHPNPYNIYDIHVDKAEINIDRTEFLNQLMWSEQILDATRYSGERNFQPSNFFSLPTKHGRILKIHSLDGKLIVFCERGVLVCFVGETMARQKSGQMVVTDSNFITGYKWIFEDLNGIKHSSICKKNNSIYFTDGFDFYSIGPEGSNNLSNGSIPLDSDNKYVTTVDDQNDEIRLSDTTEGVTWVYNYKFKQWYGPFTFVCENGTNLNKNVLSVIGTDIVSHNEGNTFNGSPYTTLIQSVANDTEQSFISKNYRKFYIVSENSNQSTFKYGKDPDQMVSAPFSDMNIKQGTRHQGITSSEQNSKTIFWDIETQQENFLLDDISWLFTNRRRR